MSVGYRIFQYHDKSKYLDPYKEKISSNKTEYSTVSGMYCTTHSVKV